VPASRPRAGRPRTRLKGDPPSPPPPGCRFHTRCPLAIDRGGVEEPMLRDTGDGRLVACHLR
jgi:oligopeptide/dipeptide ABC transporter ATP-binding protein